MHGMAIDSTGLLGHSEGVDSGHYIKAQGSIWHIFNSRNRMPDQHNLERLVAQSTNFLSDGC